MSAAQPTTVHLQENRANRRQLSVLLDSYRKIEFRTGKLARYGGGRKGSQTGANIRSIVLIYLVYGFFLGLVFAQSRIPSYLFSIALLTYTSLMAALFITAESGTLLFNSKETEVLGHLPIGARTYYLAKLLNLCMYVLIVVLPLNLPSAIMGRKTAGATVLFPLGHLVSVLMISACAASFVVICYGALLKIVRNRERLQNIITYSQIALTIFFILGYQVLPYVMRDVVAGKPWEPPVWLVAYPPAWFAAVAQVVAGHLEMPQLVAAGIAIVLTMLLAYLALQRFGMQFRDAMSDFGQTGGKVGGAASAEADPISNKVAPQTRFGEFLEKAMLVRRPEEKAMFDMVRLHMARDHEIKRRLYPTLAMMVGMPVLGIITNQSGDPITAAKGENFTFSYVVMFLAMTLSLTVMELLKSSREPEAAFVYYVSPIEKLDALYAGVRKAVLGQIVWPMILAVFLVFAVMWESPLHAFLHVLPWALFIWPVSYIPFVESNYLPLSKPVKQGQQAATNMAMVLLVMAVFGGIAYIQHQSQKHGYYWIYVGVVAAISVGGAMICKQIVRRKRKVLVQD